ncbi:MAG: hypothetical protein MUP11_13440 [Anaerolineales bacterium]|nr:hypothetical protein [Anaerolineales bacterium]
MITIESINCPKCGAPLDYKTDISITICMFCGSRVNVRLSKEKSYTVHPSTQTAGLAEENSILQSLEARHSQLRSSKYRSKSKREDHSTIQSFLQSKTAMFEYNRQIRTTLVEIARAKFNISVFEKSAEPNTPYSIFVVEVRKNDINSELEWSVKELLDCLSYECRELLRFYPVPVYFTVDNADALNVAAQLRATSENVEVVIHENLLESNIQKFDDLEKYISVFDIYLEKIRIVKSLDALHVGSMLRVIFSVGLEVAMEIVDCAPLKILWNVPETEALRLKDLIMDQGGEVRLDEVHIV